MRRFSTRCAALIVLIFAGLCVQAEPPAPELPETFTGTFVYMGNAGRPFSERLMVVVDRWSIPAERRGFYEAIRSGGTDGLLKAMEDVKVGYVSTMSSLGWRLRVAHSEQTEKGRLVRVVTDRPIAFGEMKAMTQTLDYPLGVIEFVLPPDGKPGEGTVIPMAKVSVDEKGTLQVETYRFDTGQNRFMGVEKDQPRKKKEKKKKEE